MNVVDDPQGLELLVDAIEFLVELVLHVVDDAVDLLGVGLGPVERLEGALVVAVIAGVGLRGQVRIGRLQLLLAVLNGGVDSLLDAALEVAALVAARERRGGADEHQDENQKHLGRINGRRVTLLHWTLLRVVARDFSRAGGWLARRPPCLPVTELCLERPATPNGQPLH